MEASARFVAQTPYTPTVVRARGVNMSNSTFDYYSQELEQRIILRLAEEKGVDISTAMDWYYRSRLADQVSRNINDIAYLDSKYLVRDLIKNEPELFE